MQGGEDKSAPTFIPFCSWLGFNIFANKAFQVSLSSHR